MTAVDKAVEVLAKAIHREDHGARCNCRGLLRAAIGAVSVAGAEALSAAGLLAEPTDQDQRHVIHRRMVARQANWTCSVCGWLDPSTTKPERCPNDQRETRTEWSTGFAGNPGEIGPVLPEERARRDVQEWNRASWASKHGTAVLYRREVGPWVEVPSRGGDAA